MALGTHGSQRLKQQACGLHQDLCYTSWLLAWCLGGADVFLTLSLLLELLLFLGCLIQS